MSRINSQYDGMHLDYCLGEKNNNNLTYHSVNYRVNVGERKPFEDDLHKALVIERLLKILKFDVPSIGLFTIERAKNL